MSDRVAEVRHQYRREAARYDRRWSRYLRGTLEPTLAALGGAPPGRLLDLGCGTGLLLQRIVERWPGARPIGLDASPEMLAAARESVPAGVHLLVGDAHRLPLRSGSLDTVVSSSSLHHWSEPRRALREAARVLRPGGRLVLTDWNADFRVLALFSRLLRLRDPSHHRAYRSAGAIRMLEEAGFSVRSVRSYRVGWLWGMMTLVAVRGGSEA